MLYPMDPTKGMCDTFICYRRDVGANWGKIIYEWMQQDPDNHYGRVYYSQFVSNANFLNDIQPMLFDAKNIVMVVTPGFTQDFPRTKAEFDTREIVTAQEIHTIMARMRRARKTRDIPMPRLILLQTSFFTETDLQALTLLASDFGQRDDPEMTQWLVNQFYTAGIHKLEARDTTALIHAHLKDYLSCTSVSRDLVRYKAATRIRIDPLPFRLIPQTVRLQGENITVDSLAQKLISHGNGKPASRLAVISGNGGMGKTTHLLKLCRDAQKKALKNYDPQDTLHLYLPAHRLNDCVHTPAPLYAALAKGLGFHNEPYVEDGTTQSADYADPEDFIKNRVLTGAASTGRAHCLLCIDALDEIESTASPTGATLLNHLAAELPKILDAGVAVILTSRSHTLLSGGIFMDCLQATMNPLEDMMDLLPESFRPAPKTRLARLLETPFYFTMYYNTVRTDTEEAEDRAASMLGDLYRRDMELYYHHTEPTVPGELIWNYVMRHIVKNSRENLQIQRSHCQRIFFLMCALPRVAAAALTARQLSEQQVAKLYRDAAARFRTEGWCPFWKIDTLPSYTADQLGQIPTPTEFLRFCTGTFPVLHREETADQVVYRFSHGLMLEFFAACDILNSVSCLFRDPEGGSPGLLPLDRKSMPSAILKLAGEICGERRGTPYFDRESQTWISPYDKTNNLIRRTLPSLRGREDTAILVNNLFSILKFARTQEGLLPDLSGIDFSGLDMTKCSLNHILFSRQAPGGNLNARFTGAKFDPIASFSEGHRAVIPQLSISAMIEWQPMRLLSVDEAGCCVLWDVSLGLMLDVLHLKQDTQKRCISNLTKDAEDCIWLACDSELFRLRLSPQRNRISLDKTLQLPTDAVKHLGWRADLGIYYHSVVSPLVRRLSDGSLAETAPDTRWFPDAVVNSRADTAFCMCGSPFNNNISSVGSLLCRKKNKETGVWEESCFFSEEALQAITGYTFFEYGHLFLSPNEKTLLLCVNCKHKTLPTKAAVLEFDLEKFHSENRRGQLKRLYYPISGKGAGIHSACFGVNQVYFSSYLSIYSVNALQETRRLHAGEGRLLHAQFLPGTLRFFTISDNPIRIHIFSCPTIETYRCVGQIVPTGVRRLRGVVQAFQFLPEMTFRFNDTLGYAEYPNQLRLLLQHDRGHLFEVDLSNGLTADTLSENTVLITEPVLSFHKQLRDVFSMKTDKQNLRVHFIDPNRQEFTFGLHPGWLFAGCDFEGADFGPGEAPDQFLHYIHAPENTEEADELIQTCDDDGYEFVMDNYFDEEDYFA